MILWYILHLLSELPGRMMLLAITCPMYPSHFLLPGTDARLGLIIGNRLSGTYVSMDNQAVACFLWTSSRFLIAIWRPLDAIWRRFDADFVTVVHHAWSFIDVPNYLLPVLGNQDIGSHAHSLQHVFFHICPTWRNTFLGDSWSKASNRFVEFPSVTCRRGLQQDSSHPVTWMHRIMQAGTDIFSFAAIHHDQMVMIQYHVSSL